MKRRFLHTNFRRGATLIEVLAGLVILGTLLVSVTMARGRFLRQWAEADRRIVAARETDQLIEAWLSESSRDVPISSQGATDDSDHHPWRTRVIPSPAAASVGAIVVRLQVFERSEDETPLSSVDFLLQDPRVSSHPAAGRDK
jgi:type II secretory pathway pseudopilin PulG